jgi:Flp pilus assembly protein TadG
MRIADDWRRDTRGTTALEFALISPLLLMMIGGVIDYGAYFATAHAIQQALNDAARAALGGVTAAERQALAQTTMDADLSGYSFLTPGSAVLSLKEGDQSLTLTLVFTPDGGSFELMPLAPGLPARITRTAVIVRGGY